MILPYRLLGVAIVAFAVGTWGGIKWQIGVHASKENARLELERKGEEQTRGAERRQAADVIGAINDSKKREQAARVAAAGARSERDRLRDELQASQRDLPSAPPSACLERAAALATVFNQCTERLESLAGKADGHVNDALTLEQAWPK